LVEDVTSLVEVTPVCRVSELIFPSSRLVTEASTVATQSSCSTRQIFPSFYRALWCQISTSSRRYMWLVDDLLSL